MTLETSAFGYHATIFPIAAILLLLLAVVLAFGVWKLVKLHLMALKG